jgi:TolB-like protein
MFFLPAPSALYAKGTYEVAIDSVPQGAKVYVNSRLAGTTPCTTAIMDGQYIFLAREGYKVYSPAAKTSDLARGEMRFVLERAGLGDTDPEKGLIDSMREKTGSFSMAIDWSIYESRISALMYLRSLGADLSGRTLMGADHLTPLLIAVSYGKYDVVSWLLKNGASAGFGFPISPLEMAMQANNRDIVDLLKSAGAQESAQMLLRAASNGYENEVLYLVTKENVAVNTRDENGRTALMIAAQEGKNKVVRTLLQLSADVSLRDSSGRTASDYANARLESKYPNGKGMSADSKPPEYVIAQLLDVVARSAQSTQLKEPSAPQVVQQLPQQTAQQPVQQTPQTTPQTDLAQQQKSLTEVRGKSVAIVGLVSKGLDPEIPGIVVDFLLDAFVNVGNMRVVDRSSIDKILQEQSFQAQDIIDNSKVAQIGKVSGVEYVVTGSLSKIEQTVYLNIKLISVTTAEIVGSSVALAKGQADYVDLCRDAVGKLFAP